MLGRQVTLALGNITGSSANPNHLGKHSQRCLLSIQGEVASLIEERIGKLAAGTSPLLPQTERLAHCTATPQTYLMCQISATLARWSVFLSPLDNLALGK